MFIEQISKLFLLIACVSCVSCAAVYPSKLHLDERIVGGFPINITRAPWQVSLQYRGSHFCGGSIISPQWIVTAAHCTSSVIHNLTALKIRAGSSLHSKDGNLLDVKRIIRHEKYSASTVDFDYALIELENPLQLDEMEQVIKLHNFDEVFPDNTTTFVTGWGNTQNWNESRVQLRGAEVPLVNQKICEKAYEEYGLTARMICAGFYKEGGKDACQGDSGGPLVAFTADDGEPRLVGIVSWGRGCAEPNYPGVYSRILAARDWINAHSGI